MLCVSYELIWCAHDILWFHKKNDDDNGAGYDDDDYDDEEDDNEEDDVDEDEYEDET